MENNWKTEIDVHVCSAIERMTRFKPVLGSGSIADPKKGGNLKKIALHVAEDINEGKALLAETKTKLYRNV